MSEVNSTSVSTPGSGTVDTAELVMSDNFMNDIMGSLASGEKSEAKEKEQENVRENVQDENKENTVNETEKQEQDTNTQGENVQENVQDIDPLEKRFKDSQSMIGRQANEIGQLRKVSEEQAKKLEEMGKMLEADRQKTGQDSVPYYEKLLTNSPEVLAKNLNISIEQAETLQLTARMAKDVAKDMVKPFEKMAQETAVQKEISKKDTAWYADHPDYKLRQPVMAKFLNKIYPNGPAAHGADPWQAAHLAYEHAGEVMASVHQTTTQQNDKRIVNARSADGSTRSVDASAALKPQGKPVDAKSAEIDKLFNVQAAQLIRR